MEDTFYLVINSHKVVKFQRSLPTGLNRGEIPVRVDVIVEPTAFRTPTLIRQIRIADPFEDIALSDVEFRKDFITEEEAELIRRRRLGQMRAVLEAQGYTITPPPEPEEGTVQAEARSLLSGEKEQ